MNPDYMFLNMNESEIMEFIDEAQKAKDIKLAQVECLEDDIASAKQAIANIKIDKIDKLKLEIKSL